MTRFIFVYLKVMLALNFVCIPTSLQLSLLACLRVLQNAVFPSISLCDLALSLFQPIRTEI